MPRPAPAVSPLAVAHAALATGGDWIQAVPAAALGNAWKTGGNSGTSPTNGNFLGTADNQPLELAVNGQRALRIEHIDRRAGASIHNRSKRQLCHRNLSGMR